MGRLNTLSNLLHCASDLSVSHATAKCERCGDLLTFYTAPLHGTVRQRCACGDQPLVRQPPLAVSVSRRRKASEALQRLKVTIPCPYCQQDFTTWEARPAKACKRCRCKAPYLRDHRPGYVHPPKPRQPRMGGDLKCGSAL